jgi:predicted metal-dependent HD superfamily phosphohydrolase
MIAIKFVEKFYAEKHRSFHTMKHIINVLSRLSRLSLELYYATLFHDTYYVPGNDDNEEKSCEIFKNWMKSNPIDINVDKVCRIIMATKNPFQTFSDPDEKALVEADMSIFLGSHKELIEYENQISYEFKEFPDYKKSRIKFLQKVMNFYGPNSKQWENCQFIIDYIV